VLAIDSADDAEEDAPALRGRVTVPELGGRSMRDGARRLHALGLSVRLKGSGLAVGTQPAAGATLARGDTVTLIGGSQ
jgi:cell division protein FtsI (penicillin-binding protein 3)